MRTSLKKLPRFAIVARHGRSADKKERRLQQFVAQLDDLAHASEDMEEMKDFYDSLLSSAAATTNSAYEFSESLREMGTCLLEKTALSDDEESGKVLLMLGKAQFGLQQLVDDYRSHIVKTITSPSESLVNQLQTLQDMKLQCDEKRGIYEHMIKRYREKGNLKSSKAEDFSYQQLQAARNAYDEDANLFSFRLKSLKVGQSRSLLTQASRHHAAQMCFFRRALKSLEAIEPYVKSIAQNQHIDYHFSELEDDNDDNYDSDGNTAVPIDDEHSNEYGHHREASFEFMREVKATRQSAATFEFMREVKASSQSAPLYAEEKIDPSQRFIQLQKSSSKKIHSYVLPTPSDTPVSRMKRTNLDYWHSSPLQQNTPSVLTENNDNSTTSQTPPPIPENLDYIKVKRQAFSGPLNKAGNHASSLFRPTEERGRPQLFSGPILHKPMTWPSSSPNVSPTFASSPKISELHELPRPPANQIGHSAPLFLKRNEIPAVNNPVMSTKIASPLPTPPSSIPRSFSIPSRERTTVSLPSSPVASSRSSNMAENVASDPPHPPSDQ
ncbi:uncharacterized protein At2g33490-like [Impatiens glandulifera]|uniref:uncharacterized protein At2g33490-like n=1 Tax=Impatiens glandulifera TaxID=253017 RepID=UPI001FB06FC0|nr:uncharacterized protein At2g33490-like [Impatiens glandulifera]